MLHVECVLLSIHILAVCRESCEALEQLSISQGQEEVAAAAAPASAPAAGTMMAVDAAQVCRRGVYVAAMLVECIVFA